MSNEIEEVEGEVVELPKPEEPIQKYMKEKKIRGKLIFAMIAGSRCYNLNVKSSDFDFAGVYVAPTRDVNSVRPPKSYHTENNPDIVLWEIGVFIDLLKKDNPKVIQMIYSKRMFWSTEEWNQLIRGIQENYVSKKTLDAYFKYVERDIKRLKKAKKDVTKVTSHAYRELFEIEEMMKGKLPKIWFEKGTERHTFLMNLRQRQENTELFRSKHLKNLNEILRKGKKKYLKVKKVQKDNRQAIEFMEKWMQKIRKKNK